MIIDESPIKSKRRYFVWLFAFGLPCFCFLYCCSGMAWPMFHARGRLSGRMSELAGVSLPSSAVVKQAARMAQRDSSEYYDVEMSVADADALFHAIKHKTPADSVKIAAEPWLLGPTPGWWKVHSVGSTLRLELPPGSRQQTMIFLLTPGSGNVLICWAEF
ncbi:MAG: hypothetical protein QM754_17750 [Tepidisphaeraceae bacterium]